MSGSVRKRGRKWYIVYDLPRTADGRRHQKWERVEGGKREAEALLAERLTEVARGLRPSRAKYTVGEYLDTWLERTQARVMIESENDREISPATFRGYHAYVTHTIKPVLGAVPLAKLDTLHIEDAISKWRKMKPQKGKRTTLSRRTVHHAYTTLRTALQAAYHRYKLIPYNPCDAVEAPKKSQRSLESLDLDTATLLYTHRSTEPVHVAAMCELLTGARRSEVLALGWDDVDLKAGRAFFHRAVTKLLDGTLGFKENKTPKSRRMLPLSSDLLVLLRAYRAEHPDATLLFSNRGAFWHPETFSSALARHFKKLGIRGASAQRLRHTFNSLGGVAGSSDVVRSRLLGHSNVRMGNDNYTTVFESQGREAVQGLEDLLRRGCVSSLLANQSDDA